MKYRYNIDNNKSPFTNVRYIVSPKLFPYHKYHNKNQTFSYFNFVEKNSMFI